MVVVVDVGVDVVVGWKERARPGQSMGLCFLQRNVPAPRGMSRKKNRKRPVRIRRARDRARSRLMCALPVAVAGTN